MEYSKPIMKISELIEMGFPKEYLLRAYRASGQTFAVKMDPLKKNSPIIFETKGFEAWRVNDSLIQRKARARRRGVI